MLRVTPRTVTGLPTAALASLLLSILITQPNPALIECIDAILKASFRTSITSFGDPNLKTDFSSSGSKAVGGLLLSPLFAPLFVNGICFYWLSPAVATGEVGRHRGSRKPEDDEVGPAMRGRESLPSPLLGRDVARADTLMFALLDDGAEQHAAVLVEIDLDHVLRRGIGGSRAPELRQSKPLPSST